MISPSKATVRTIAAGQLGVASWASLTGAICAMTDGYRAGGQLRQARPILQAAIVGNAALPGPWSTSQKTAEFSLTRPASPAQDTSASPRITIVAVWGLTLSSRSISLSKTVSVDLAGQSIRCHAGCGSYNPLKRDLAYLKLLEELLGPEWVERWARERGKLEALRVWRFQENDAR